MGKKKLWTSHPLEESEIQYHILLSSSKSCFMLEREKEI